MDWSPTLPLNLCLRHSVHPVRGYQVWSVKEIPIRTRFGPYEGVFRAADSFKDYKISGFQWKVETKEREIMILDGNNGKKSNWLRYVNYACNKEEQNLIAVQHTSKVYYITCKYIPANTELRVWYRDIVDKHDKNKRKDYSKNEIGNRDNIRSSASQSDQKRTDETNEKIHHTEETLRHRASVSGDSFKKVIKNTTNEDDLNLQAETTLLAYNTLDKPITNRKTFFRKEQKGKETLNLKNNEKTEIKHIKELNSLKREIVGKRKNKSNLYRNKIIKGTSLKRQEVIHKSSKRQKSEESEKKLVNDKKSYLMEGDETVVNMLNSNKDKINYRKNKKLNLHKWTYNTKKSYECDAHRKTSKSCEKLKTHEMIRIEDNSYNICKNKLRHCSQINVRGKIHIDKKLYECQVCGKKCEDHKKLKIHERNHFVGKRYECNICGKKYKFSTGLKVHEMVHTGEKPYKCQVCQKKFKTFNHLKLHKSVHSDETPYECHVCGQKFKSFSNLTRHGRIHTDEKPYECQVCEKKFRDSGSLKLHKRSHTDEKPYECRACGNKYGTAYGLRIHRRIHTGEKPYQCRVCDKKFKTSSELKVHERIHTGEKPYRCSVCGKKFKANGELKVHERIHTGEKPYECQICEKKFTSRSELKLHERLHTGEKPYKCQICGKEFRSSSDLKVHERTHTGAKPYECKICGKKFSGGSNFRVHKKIHTGEKRWECNVCGKKFTRKSSLKLHEKLHTGEKPYECNICGKKFKSGSELNKHEMTHFSEKLYGCNMCEKKFTRKMNLTLHEKRHNHGRNA